MIHLQETPVISIVDDDESIRTATASLAQALGFRAYAFASAQEFLRSSHMSETSCLISDIQMPHMSGIDLQNLLIARGNRMPIIFITAYPDEKICARVLDAGAVCFLSKPFDAQTLITCLHEAVKGQDRGTA
jgi:FixJ family two-component response regulator